MLGNSDATIRALKDDIESLEKINTMFDSLLEKAGEKYRAEHENGQKNNADQTALKYSLNSNARVELHKALYDMNYRNEVLLRDNTPQIMLDQRGVKNLPMVMKASHIRENVFTEEEARKLGLKVNKGSHYHGIGEEQFLAIVDGLDNVSEAYRGTPNANYSTRRENYFLLVSKFKDKNGNTINVPVYINERAQYNHVYIETNKIATVYGNDDFRNYINQQVQRKNLVRIKIKSNKSSEGDTPLLSAYRDTALDKDIIPEVKKSVKANFSYKSEHENGQKNNADQTAKYSMNNTIVPNMNDSERSDILKNTKIDIVTFESESMNIDSNDAVKMKDTCKSQAEKYLKELCKKFGLFKSYKNENIELEFNYSNRSLSESTSQQNKRTSNFYDFARMLYVFDDVVKNAQPIETHTDKYKGTKREDKNLNQVYVLLSAFAIENEIIPVEFSIKEFKDKTENKIYVSVTLQKIRADLVGRTLNAEHSSRRPKSTLNYSLLDIIKNVNPQDSDFLRYVPDGLLNQEQIKAKREALFKENQRIQALRNERDKGLPTQKSSIKTSDENLPMYSTKETSPVQAHWAEAIRENHHFRNIMSLIDEMQLGESKIQLNSRDIDRIARELIKSASSKYDQKEFADKLTIIYDYMANSGKNADTEEIYKSLLTVANGILEQSEMKDTELYDQYKNVRDFLRNQPIYITPQVKKEIVIKKGLAHII